MKTVKQCLLTGGTVAAVSIATALALYGGARILLALESRRAASLLDELGRVQLGQSAASVQPLLQRAEDLQFRRGMGEEQGSHFVSVDPWHFYRSFLGPHWIDALVREAIFKFGKVRRKSGLRAWVVNGRLTIKNGQVESVSATLTVEGENEWLMADWNYASEISAQILNSQGPQTDSEVTHYLVRWSHLHMGAETGEVITNSITPQGTPGEQHAAREVNLNA